MANRTIETTHKIMSAIKQKDTTPELLLRRAIWARGLRFRKNYKKLPGKPDIVFTRARLVVFCDGDFWHGHNWAIRGIGSLESELEGYSDFWKRKIMGNIAHDKLVTTKLEEDGWTVIRIWESDIRNNLDAIADLVISEYKRLLIKTYSNDRKT